MNTFSKVSLLLTAVSALFLPACGGGGEGGSRDYYVSVQAFRTGTRGFYVSSSPSAWIYANPNGLNGKYYSLSEHFAGLVGGDTSGAYGDDPRPGDDGGVFTRGQFRCDGQSPDTVDLGYYTSGGASGQGYLYVAFQGAPNDEIAHFVGANNPNDVKVAGLPDNAALYWYIPDTRQLLILTTNGATIKVVFNFSTGFAEVRFIVASVGAGGGSYSVTPGGNMNDPGADYTLGEELEGEQVLVKRAMPFFAVDQ